MTVSRKKNDTNSKWSSNLEETKPGRVPAGMESGRSLWLSHPQVRLRDPTQVLTNSRKFELGTTSKVVGGHESPP